MKSIFSILLFCLPVLSKNIEDLSRLIKIVDDNNQSVALSDLDMFQGLPNLPPQFQRTLLNMVLSNIHITSRFRDYLAWTGETSLDTIPLLVEVRAFKEENKEKSPTFTTDSTIHKKILNFPDNDTLANNPIESLQTFLPKEDLYQIVGEVKSETQRPLSLVQQKNNQQNIYVNQILDRQKLAIEHPANISTIFTNENYISDQSVHYSVMLVLPAREIAQVADKIAPRLAKSLRLLRLENAVLIYSTGHYFHMDLQRDIWPGLNIFGSIKTSALHEEPLRSSIDFLSNYVQINNLDSLTFYGLISPDITGSIFNIDIPGTLKIGKKISTKALQLRLELTNDTIPIRASLKTGLNIAMPRQDPMELLGSLDFLPPSHFSVAAELPGNWKNPFGIPHLELFDVGVEIGTDLEVVLASEGSIPITDLGGRGKLKLDFGTMDVAFFISVAEDERMLMYGNFSGKISLKNLAEQSLKMYSDEHKNSSLITTIKTDIQKYIPDLSLREAEFFISPAHQIVAHKEYHKGMSLKAKMDIWDDHINFETKISSKGIQTLAYIPAFHIGPLYIKGPKYKSDSDNSYELASVSKINTSSGPIMYFNVDTTKGHADFFVDAHVSANILSGLSADTRIYFSKQGAQFSLNEKIGDTFEAKLNFSTENHETSRDLMLSGEFEKSGLSFLEYKLRALSPNSKIQALKNAFAHARDVFDFTRISFNANFEDMKQNKLSLDIEFALLGKKFDIKDLSIDFDNINASIEHLATKLAGKIARHSSL